MESQGLLTGDKAAGNEAGSSPSYRDSLDHHADNKDAYVELNGVFAGEDLCKEAAIQAAEPGTELKDRYKSVKDDEEIKDTAVIRPPNDCMVKIPEKTP
ncbi:MAG: hypothetical protein Q9179_001797 [Wetmoreana sp. 5 TL-2023]